MPHVMPYVLLGLAIAAEVTATLSLRASEGFSKLGPSSIVVVGYIVSFVLLAKALTALNVGPVYAIWSALGTVGAFAGGALLFDEPVRPVTLIGAGIILVGVVVMNLGGGVSHG
ncbi:SMR family transporter [Actinomadura fulvescens]|uniref:Multidrug efflux SMR transporter n=1 Tax=Actinomadura fulvescens TaxID=46160 RepID=A0ABP6C043_9ACTN